MSLPACQTADERLQETRWLTVFNGCQTISGGPGPTCDAPVNLACEHVSIELSSPSLWAAGGHPFSGDRVLAADRGGSPNDFDAAVAPILVRRCLDCHSGADPKGKLDLSRRASAFAGGESGAAIVAGKPDESLLWEKVEAGEMPPKSPLSDAEKAAIRGWIAGGAAWGTDPIDPSSPDHDPPGRPRLVVAPAGRGAPSRRRPRTRAGPARAIDRFVLAKLEADGLSPAPEADRRTLIRRLSFDLTGLPPTPEEVDAFLADRSADAYERLVDRYLASPQYGVRWARWWLDLARYGESNGFEFDEFRPAAWRYRDWVVDSLQSRPAL